MKFDLHMHSCYSKDGELTCEELMKKAKEKGLECIALSDHDGMRGIDEMIALGKQYDIQVIPAMEFTTMFHDVTECHLLGYGMDYHAEYFVQLEKEIDDEMKQTFHKRVEKLEQYYGIHIDKERVLKEAGNENPWFLMCQYMFEDPNNAHIEAFEPYRKGGSRSDPAPVNFFWDCCQKGSPLYVETKLPSFHETVQKIHEAGGIAVLAHPAKAFYQREDLLQMALADGIEGLEVYSNYHEEEQVAYYRNYALQHGLLMTCGSDFHGKHKPSIELGSYGVVENSDALIASFLEKLNK